MAVQFSLGGFWRCAVAAVLIATTVAPASAQIAALPPGDSRPPPPAPPPPNPDPRDFSGNWKAVPQRGFPGGVRFDDNLERLCLPQFALVVHGIAGSTDEDVTQFVQTPHLLALIVQVEHIIRQIRINGTHPADLAPSDYGDSIGHWEGNTLVVETTGIKGRLTPGGALVSPQMTMTERFRKLDGGAALEDQISFADPVGEELPPPYTVRLNWVAPKHVVEWICEDDGTDYWNPSKK